MTQWIEHQTSNTSWLPAWVRVPTGAKIFVTLLVPLGKALYSDCSVFQRSRKANSPVYMYLNINRQACTIKNITDYSKRAGDHPGTVDCTSKLHSSTLGSRVWGKDDCGPFESPLRRSNLGLLQSIQYRYRNPGSTIPAVKFWLACRPKNLKCMPVQKSLS